jgi:hypothetical protein
MLLNIHRPVSVEASPIGRSHRLEPSKKHIVAMINPSHAELLGYSAGVLVILAFLMRNPIGLRWLALASNVLFIAYALAASLAPVLVLHLVLLIINLARLFEVSRLPAGCAQCRKQSGHGSDGGHADCHHHPDSSRNRSPVVETHQ